MIDFLKNRRKWLAVFTCMVTSFLFFTIGLIWFFPKDALRQRVKHELEKAHLLKTPYTVSIEEVGLHLLRPGLALQKVTISQIASPEAKSPPVSLTLDAAHIYLSWMDVFLGRSSPHNIDIDLQLLGGTVSLKRLLTETNQNGSMEFVMESTSLQIDTLSKIFLQLPVEGTVSLKGKLILPLAEKADQQPAVGRFRLRDMQGDIEIKLSQVMFGGEHITMPWGSIPFPEQSQMLKGMLQSVLPAGLPLPRTQLGNLRGRLRIQNKQILAEGMQFQKPSAPPKSAALPVSISIDGFVSLEDSLEWSKLYLYVRILSWSEWLDACLTQARTSFGPKVDKTLQQEIEKQIPELKKSLQVVEREDKTLGIAIRESVTQPKATLQRTPPDSRITLQPIKP